VRALVIYPSLADPKAQPAMHLDLQSNRDGWRRVAIPAPKRGNIKNVATSIRP
jgi:hypothetical protein